MEGKRNLSLLLLAGLTGFFRVASSFLRTSSFFSAFTTRSWTYRGESVTTRRSTICSLSDIKVGQEVTIELINSGALEHEFMVGRDVKMTNNRPDGYERDMFAAAHAEPVKTGGKPGGMDMSGHGSEQSGFMVIVLTGSEKATVTFTATKDIVGEWEIGCFAQGGVHYDAGMKGKLVVLP